VSDANTHYLQASPQLLPPLPPLLPRIFPVLLPLAPCPLAAAFHWFLLMAAAAVAQRVLSLHAAPRLLPEQLPLPLLLLQRHCSRQLRQHQTPAAVPIHHPPPRCWSAAAARPIALLLSQPLVGRVLVVPHRDLARRAGSLLAEGCCLDPRN